MENKKNNIIVAFSIGEFEKLFKPVEEIRKMARYLKDVRPYRFDHGLVDKFFEFIDELKGFYD